MRWSLGVLPFPGIEVPWVSVALSPSLACGTPLGSADSGLTPGRQVPCSKNFQTLLTPNNGSKRKRWLSGITLPAPAKSRAGREQVRMVPNPCQHSAETSPALASPPASQPSWLAPAKGKGAPWAGTELERMVAGFIAFRARPELSPQWCSLGQTLELELQMTADSHKHHFHRADVHLLICNKQVDKYLIGAAAALSLESELVFKVCLAH